MKPRILIAIHYMHLGGAEISLIGLLQALDPNKVDIDLFVYSHEGDLMKLIPDYVNVLPEIPAYKMFERPMKEVLKKEYDFVKIAGMAQTRIETFCDIAEKYGASTNVHSEYPAWEYKENSYLREVCQNVYKNMKINESQLRKIIQESINGILNEITSTPGMGWMGLQFEEDDWTPVNEPNEGDVCYKIKLWSGSGYHLDAFKVYAEPNDYETALEILVAYFDRENINTYFVDDWVEEEMEDLREKGVSEDDLYEELSKSGDYYIDATMEGASKPHWLRGENLQMQAFPLKENKKNNKHCSSINEGGYSKLERDIDGKTLLDGAVIRRLRKMAEQIDYISSMSSDKMQDVCSDILNVFWKHKIY